MLRSACVAAVVAVACAGAARGAIPSDASALLPRLAPLQFTRISSRFARDRWHPVLRRHRAHLGVDFAAPRGTPVHAVARGRVLDVGRRWPNGRFVHLEHAGDVESWYAHLGRIDPALRPGDVVRRGHVIGWVGASGCATGPHLHFALSRDGWYFDPLDPAAPPIFARRRTVTLSATLARGRRRVRTAAASARVRSTPPAPSVRPARADLAPCTQLSLVPAAVPGLPGS